MKERINLKTVLFPVVVVIQVMEAVGVRNQIFNWQSVVNKINALPFISLNCLSLKK